MTATVLFANPTAQSGKAADWIARARELLDASGIAHDFIATEPAGGTVGLVRAAINDSAARRVIYMGGDGTFAEVAKGILGSNHTDEVVLGMLPTGTANDQGKSFGLQSGPSGLERNIEVIAAGVTMEIDVGRLQRIDAAGDVVESDLFFDSSSIGWGAQVLETRNRDRDAVSNIPVVRAVYRDHLVYAKAIFQHLFKAAAPWSKFALEAIIDGERYYYESLIDVIIKNTHVFGGEWVLSEDTEADDGLFEMVPIRGVRDFTSKMLVNLRHHPVTEEDLNKLGIEHSKPVQGSTFDLTIIHPGAESPPAVQIDGEEFTPGDRFRYRVLSRVLRIVVPREHAQDQHDGPSQVA